MGPLEITDVRLAGPPPSRIRGFFIDEPHPGPVPAGAKVQISGWIAAADLRASGAVLYCQGTLIRATSLTISRPDAASRYPGTADTCGFSILLTPLELPQQFELTLFAVFENHQQVQLATISGKHFPALAPAPLPAKPLQPLMVTSLGRSGTTYLMRLLSQHPQIVADRTYPYEANAARYWMHLVRLLTQPPVRGRITRPFDIGDFAEPPYVETPIRITPPLQQYVGGDYPALAAEFARRATDGFYRQVAQSNNQPDPVYFCEKVLPSGIRFMLWNLYEKPREIFLVRDFRDVVCSVFAFNKKRGIVAFGRNAVSTDEDYLPQLRQAARNLLDTYRGCANNALLIRYEDLILSPQKILTELLTYLGLEPCAAVIEAMTKEASADTPQLEKHRTTASPEASIGRWHKDLSPAMQDLCRKSFDDLLPLFGYKLDKHGDLLIANI